MCVCVFVFVCVCVISQIDSDGYGQILFKEFTEWAVRENVIAHEAIDFPDEDDDKGQEGEEEGAGGPAIKPLSEHDEFQQIASMLPVTKVRRMGRGAERRQEESDKEERRIRNEGWR